MIPSNISHILSHLVMARPTGVCTLWCFFFFGDGGGGVGVERIIVEDTISLTNFSAVKTLLIGIGSLHIGT